MEHNSQQQPIGTTIDSGQLNLHAPGSEDTTDYEIVSLIEPVELDPSKTGPKPKKLVAVEVMGYQVGRGLNRKVISPEEVYKLAAIGCTYSEISRWFSIPEQTLKYNFSEIIDKGREDMKQTLRRAMIKNALNGNAAVQIFLAKNLLGMSDTPVDSEANAPLPWDSKEL